MTNYQKFTVWSAQILMGVLFIIASSGKITSVPEVVQQFDAWGYPHGFYMIIGILELLGGILLFYPLTAGYATIVLSAVMIGATFTHLIHQEGLVVFKPIGYMAILMVVFYFRFILAMKEDDAAHFPLNKAI